MTATGRTTEPTAAAIESAEFVRILARPDGDALAATGVLARALADRETPFQTSVVPTVAERTARAPAGADPAEPTVVVGPSDGDARHLDPQDRPATLAACELVRELGETPDPVLALAGAFAGGVEPGAGETERLVETARERGSVTRRPGVAVPTDDPVDGLAYTTLVHAPWSGDPDAVRDAVAVVDDPTEDDRRRVGSLVALDAVGDEDATDHAAEAVSRVLHPHETIDGPFATVGGFADLLEATARERPGAGVALALAHGAREAALDAWRDHGRRAHAALDSASTGRYDGLFVLGIDDDLPKIDSVVETVARLAANYRSPEPAVLAIGDGAAGIATVDYRSLDVPFDAIARTLEADHDRGPWYGSLRFDPELDDVAVIDAVRDAI